MSQTKPVEKWRVRVGPVTFSLCDAPDPEDRDGSRGGYCSPRSPCPLPASPRRSSMPFLLSPSLLPPETTLSREGRWPLLVGAGESERFQTLGLDPLF